MPYKRTFTFEDRCGSQNSLKITELDTPDRVRLEVMGYTVFLSRADVDDLHNLTAVYQAFGNDYLKFVELDPADDPEVVKAVEDLGEPEPQEGAHTNSIELQPRRPKPTDLDFFDKVDPLDQGPL